MMERHESNPVKGPKALPALLVVLLLALALMPLPSAAAIGIDDPQLRLDKVDPGHQSVHMRDVTNNGDEPVQVDLRVTCPCPIYVSVSPESFELAPGQTRSIEIQVDVPLDADPGIHDTRIQVTERSADAPGGTAVASASINAVFFVRSAKLYLNAASTDDVLSARFVNAFAENLTVQVNGTLQGPGIERDVAVFESVAPGHPERSRTTQLQLPLPFQDDDPGGVYTVTVWASWHNASTDNTGVSGPHSIEVAHGALVQLKSFQAVTAPDGLRFTATMASVATQAGEAWLVVDTIGPDGTTRKVEGPPIGLDPGEEQEVTFGWSPEAEGRYELRAHAAYRVDGTEGRSSTWPMVEAVAPPPATSDTPDDDLPPTQRNRNDPALLAIVALVGVGLGAVIAILARRGGRRA